MPHNEADNIQAIKNQLLERKRALDNKHREELRRLQAEYAAQSRKLEEYAKALSDLQGDLPSLLSGELPRGDEGPSNVGRVDIGGYIDRYLNEVGAESLTAATLKAFVLAQGVEPYPSLYNSIHEALRRRVARGELEKVEGKFRPKSHADE